MTIIRSNLLIINIFILLGQQGTRRWTLRPSRPRNCRAANATKRRAYARRLTPAAPAGAPSLSFVPTLTIVSITGTSSRPNADSEYSTDGGEEGTTSRITTPFPSSARNRAANIFGEIPGMSF